MRDGSVFAARAIGILGGLASICLVGFTIGESRPRLTFLTVLVAPLLYLTRVRILEHWRRQQLKIDARASPRLAGASPSTSTATPGADANAVDGSGTS